MYYRYPRLPRNAAGERVAQLQNNNDIPVFALSDAQSTPVETGTVVSDRQLEAVRNSLKLATKEFPATLRAAEVAAWDAAAGRALYEHMKITPADASHIDTWSFVTLVLLPDFAIWRYPARQKNRLVGTHRNVFRRVWWRHHVLGNLSIPEGGRPLGEDELVNIFERSRMARDHRLARVLAEEIIAFKGSARSVFARQLTLNVRALTGSLLLDICSENTLKEIVGEVSKQLAKSSTKSDSASDSQRPTEEKRSGKQSRVSRILSAVRKRSE